ARPSHAMNLRSATPRNPPAGVNRSRALPSRSRPAATGDHPWPSGLDSQVPSPPVEVTWSPVAGRSGSRTRPASRSPTRDVVGASHGRNDGNAGGELVSRAGRSSAPRTASVAVSPVVLTNVPGVKVETLATLP